MEYLNQIQLDSIINFEELVRDTKFSALEEKKYN
jgi:hypothetical protein